MRLDRRLFLLTPMAAAAGSSDEQAIRRIVERWDAGYRRMDGQAMAELSKPDYSIVNRTGFWIQASDRSETAELFNTTFREIYKGKPGPEHKIEQVRFIHADVAEVYLSAFWPDEITLDDGQRIPPHGEIVLLTMVRQEGSWRIATESVHNYEAPFGRAGERLTPERLFQSVLRK